MAAAERIDLGQPGDFHVHLRDGEMKNLVAPLVREGGVSVVYVMPNLVPPLTDPERVIEYQESLQELSPRTKFLMSLYLRPEVTPEVIGRAHELGITGVKVYPAGVTTNSDGGVDNYDEFFPTFAEMERLDMVLNIHGEVPAGPGVTVLNAEEKFLPMLETLHSRFPRLRIILEHCTSAAAVAAVRKCGPTVAATITAHHLYLTVDSWGGCADHFCKPVAKLPSDRDALIEAATSGDPKFFFGSDSAPHPVEAKQKAAGAAAGVFTQGCALSYVAQVFSDHNKLDRLRGFVSEFGSNFYKVDKSQLDQSTVSIVKTGMKVPERYTNFDVTVVPFLAGKKLDWVVEWSS